jgi:O-antigen/teichoic acid export membrane protein
VYHQYEENFTYFEYYVESDARPAQILLRNTAWLLAAQVILKLLGFYSTIVVANHLDVENFGLFNFAISFTTLFIPIFDFGLDAFLVREIAVGKEDSQNLLGSAVLSKLVLSVFGFAAILFISFFVDAAHSHERVILLAAVALFLKNLSTSFVSLLRGNHRMDLDAKISIVSKIAEVGLTLAAVWLYSDLVKILWFLIFAATFQLAYSIFVAYRHTHSAIVLSMRLARKLLRGGMPFALTGLSVMIYFHIDTVMLSMLVNDKAVGIYRAAYNIVLAATTFSSAFVIALFPMIARLYDTDRDTAVRLSSRVIFYALVFSLPVALGGTLIASQFIGRLYLPSFGEAAFILQILLWWVPLSSVTSILGFILGGMNLQRYVLGVSLVNAVFNVVANLILIPIISYVGASIVTVLTELLGLLLLSLIVKKQFGNVFKSLPVNKLVMANAFLLPVLLLTNMIPLVWLLGAGAALYITGLFATKTVSWTELTKLKLLLLNPQ